MAIDHRSRQPYRGTYIDELYDLWPEYEAKAERAAAEDALLHKRIDRLKKGNSPRATIEAVIEALAERDAARAAGRPWPPADDADGGGKAAVGRVHVDGYTRVRNGEEEYVDPHDRAAPDGAAGPTAEPHGKRVSIAERGDTANDALPEAERDVAPEPARDPQPPEEPGADGPPAEASPSNAPVTDLAVIDRHCQSFVDVVRAIHHEIVGVKRSLSETIASREAHEARREALLRDAPHLAIPAPPRPEKRPKDAKELARRLFEDFLVPGLEHRKSEIAVAKHREELAWLNQTIASEANSEQALSKNLEWLEKEFRFRFNQLDWCRDRIRRSFEAGGRR